MNEELFRAEGQIVDFGARVSIWLKRSFERPYSGHIASYLRHNFRVA